MRQKITRIAAIFCAVTALLALSQSGRATANPAAAPNPQATPPPPPDLMLTKTHTGNFIAGTNGVYTITVRNVAGAGPTTGPIEVADTLPNGLSFVAGSGSGWSCSSAGQAVTCRHQGVLASGASSVLTLTAGVSRAAVPSVTNLATVTTTGETNTANNSASDPTTVDPYYTYDVIARSGDSTQQGTLTSLGNGVSINDGGSVAFVGVLAGGQGLFIGDGQSSPRNIVPGFFRTTVSFAPTVQISNTLKVIAREEVSAAAGAPRQQFLRIWDGSPSAADPIAARLANSNSGIDPSPSYQTINAPASLNNADNYSGGNYVFSGFDGSSTLLEPGISTLPSFPRFRPMIADTAAVVVRYGSSPTSSPIRLFDAAGSFQNVACGSGCLHPGFSQLGEMPGISDTGDIVAFAGNVGASSSGIYVSVETGPGTRQLIRVAGEQVGANGCLQPELGRDAGGTPLCLSSLQVNDRVGVSHVAGGASGMVGDSFVVAFLGTPNAAAPGSPSAFSAAKGLWTVQVDVTGTSSGSLAVAVGSPQIVAQIGDLVQGRTLADVGVYDPIANISSLASPTLGSHRIAFWASTTTGSDLVVRATHVGSPQLRRLTFIDQPSDEAMVGGPFEEQPSVGILKPDGTPDFTDSTTVVNLQKAPGSGSGKLDCPGGSQSTMQNGVARFSGCQVDAAGVYTVLAAVTSDPSIVPAISAPVVAACTGVAVTRPARQAVNGRHWRIGTVDVSDDDGLVLSDLTFIHPLKQRYVIRKMSLPYLHFQSTALANKKFELKADSDDDTARSRLTDFSVREDPSGVLVVQAKYAIDRIPAGSADCLLVTQSYEFYPDEDPTVDPCEPSGTFRCARFKPIVNYEFLSPGSNSVTSMKSAQRLIPKPDGRPNHTGGLFQDCDLIQACIGIFGDLIDPVTSELRFAAVVGGQKGPWDNYHQTWRPDVSEPNALQGVLAAWTGLIGGGCPECVHIHWRWSDKLDDVGIKEFVQPSFLSRSFNGGRPLTRGSPQNIEIGIAVSRDDEEDPQEDFSRIIDTNTQPEILSGREIAFWYSAQSSRQSDAFFTHGGFVYTLTDLNTTAGAFYNLRPQDYVTKSTPIDVTFDSVTEGGETTLVISDNGPVVPMGFSLGNPATYYDLSTTASYSGNIQVCIDYAAINFPNGSVPRLYHFENGQWIDRTISVNTTTQSVCGSVSGFSFFALFVPVSSTATPTLTLTSTATTTETPTATATLAQSPITTSTPTPTVTPSQTATGTLTPTATRTPTNTAIATGTGTLTPTGTAAASNTPTPTFTPTLHPHTAATHATTTLTPSSTPTHNPSPVARFTWSCAGLTCILDASTSTDDLGIVSYNWNLNKFPNGTAAGPIVTTSYPHSGPRHVTLTVTDTTGQTNSITQVVTVP